MKNHTNKGFVLLFTLVVGATFFAITAGLANRVVSLVQLERHTYQQVDALAIAEAGMDKAISELNKSPAYIGEIDTPLGKGTFTVTAIPVNNYTRRITVASHIPDRHSPVASKTITATVSINNSLISFHYGLQVGDGGIIMNNGSNVQGSVYSNGPISGGGSISGDATAAASSTITDIAIGGDAQAYSMYNCTVTGQASYEVSSTCLALLGSTGGVPNAPALPMPISDQQVLAWENIASSTSIITGTYTITGDQTLGPVKIEGDLIIGVGAKLRIAGPIWVEGDVDFGNNSYFLVDASAGTSGAVLIADVPTNRTTQGLIDLSNNITIAGNGNPNSFPMALSMSSSTDAIVMNNNANSVLLYAPYGTVKIGNNASANQITGYAIELKNNATIVYIAGLQNAGFSNGPSGAWAVDRGTYVIIPN